MNAFIIAHIDCERNKIFILLRSIGLRLGLHHRMLILLFLLLPSLRMVINELTPLTASAIGGVFLDIHLLIHLNCSNARSAVLQSACISSPLGWFNAFLKLLMLSSQRVVSGLAAFIAS